MQMRHWTRTLALLLIFASAALHSGCAAIQTAPDSISLTDSPVDIPGGFERGVFVAEATIDGVGPFRLIVDTGSDAVALRPEAAARLSAKRGAQHIITDGAGSHGVTSGTLRLSTLKLDAFEVSNLDAIIHDFSGLQGLFSDPIDGVIGFPVFRDVALIFDRSSSSVQVARPVEERPASTGVFKLVGKRANFELPMLGRSFRVLADTGANTTLDLRDGDLDGYSYSVVGDNPARTLRSSVSRRLVRLNEEFEFAGRNIAAASIYIGGRYRVLGTEWMRHFRVVFDQPNGVIVFESADPSVTG